jgi:hypothetical protein
VQASRSSKFVVQVSGPGGGEANSWVGCSDTVLDRDCPVLASGRSDDRLVIRAINSEQELAILPEELLNELEVLGTDKFSVKWRLGAVATILICRSGVVAIDSIWLAVNDLLNDVGLRSLSTVCFL